MLFSQLEKAEIRQVGVAWAVLYFSVLLLLSPFAPVLADEAGEAQTWGEDTQVIRYDRFFIAGQPDEAALENARMNDVSLVINLRSESEFDWDEQGASESLGMSFHRVPVNARSDQLAKEPFDRINEIVEANPDSGILVHCSTGNRAAAWLAVYLVEVEGMNAADALEVAKASGLTKKGLESKVRAYLQQ